MFFDIYVVDIVHNVCYNAVTFWMKTPLRQQLSLLTGNPISGLSRSPELMPDVPLW